MSNNFERNLIIGRTAENIFEMMFRETGDYIVQRFGYEYSLSAVAQYQNLAERKDVIDQVRHNPDFVLIKHGNTEFYFIEVKYRSHHDESEVLKIATEISQKWPVSHLFMVYPDGFFYNPVQTIINRHGKISKLSKNYVSQEIQEKYLLLVQDFLAPHHIKN